MSSFLHTESSIADNAFLVDRGFWLRNLRCVLIATLAYYCLDRLMVVSALSDGWTICWPLNGITIALLLMRPRAEWPAIMFGVALGTGAMESHYQINHISTVLQRLFSVTEVVLSAAVLPKFVDLDHWLREPNIYLRFCIALVVGPAFSGILAAVWFHHLSQQGYLSAFNDWATADALGIAIMMPLSLSVRSKEMRQLFSREQLWQTLQLLALMVVVSVVVFDVAGFGVFFVIFPVLLLVDSVLGFAGSAIAMPIVCAIAIYGETLKHGPFARLQAMLPISNDVALQVFLGFQVLALFPASILFRQRKRLQAEIRETNQQLAMLASLDGLTVIPNRRSFDERLAMEWQRAGRQQDSLALLMVDIDHFKQFNDRYGHMAGDVCLKAVAEELHRQVNRPTDMVARFGGEEFTVLLPDTSAKGAAQVAQRLCEAIRSLAIPHEASDGGYVTVSIGCACRTSDEMVAAKDLLQLADDALYAAKRGGRNRFQMNPVSTFQSDLQALLT